MLTHPTSKKNHSVIEGIKPEHCHKPHRERACSRSQAEGLSATSRQHLSFMHCFLSTQEEDTTMLHLITFHDMAGCNNPAMNMEYRYLLEIPGSIPLNIAPESKVLGQMQLKKLF